MLPSITQPTPKRIPRSLRLGLAVLVLAAVFAAFAPALSAGFVLWDDDRYLVDRSGWRGLSLDHLKWMVTTDQAGHRQPLSWLTLGIDHALWGMDARGYHFTNVLLHALGAVAFFALALKLLPLCTHALEGTRLGWAAASAALFFGVHPLRVESVAWITERRDVLSGLFFTLSILAYLRFATGATAKARRGAYAAALVCLLLSLLAKASGMALPGVLFLLDLWPLRRPWKRSLAEKIPFVMLVLPFAALALRAQASEAGLRSLGELGIVERIALASYSAIFYSWKTLAPVGLSPIYELPAVFDPLELRFLGAVAATVAVTALLFARRRSIPAIWTAWMAFLVVLAPVSGLAHVGPQLVADRYSYLACMPFALLAAGALFVSWPRTAPAAALVLVAVLGCLSWRQTLLWRDTEILFARALEIDSRSWVAHEIVGRMRAMRGRKTEAEEHYRAAITVAPGQPNPHNNLGLLLLEEGRNEEAVLEFRETLRARPGFETARGNLGVALFSLGRLSEAEIELRVAMSQAPGDPAARVNLGSVLLALDRPAEAAEQFEAALAVSARSAEAHEGLSQAYSKLGRNDLAAEHLRRARALRPH